MAGDNHTGKQAEKAASSVGWHLSGKWEGYYKYIFWDTVFISKVLE